MRWSVPQDEGEIKYIKTPPCSATSRDGLEIEIKFFLEANFVGGFRLNSPKRKSFMGLYRVLYQQSLLSKLSTFTRLRDLNTSISATK